jgi:hypothetical protein
MATFRAWLRSVSVLASTQVASMDADVMITAAFCLEVFLIALAAAVLLAREARKGRAKVGPESTDGSAAKASPRVTARPSHTVRGIHS